MPSALPGLSAQKAAELLQQTNRMIKSVPEVARVYGKAGRAETATDPAPLEMFETTIQFKPRDQWRPGMTPEKLVEELDQAVKVPGLANIWVPPIRNRIDMLATGIKSPIGVKVAGSNLADIDRIAQDVERIAKTVPGVSSALAERLTGGRYIDVDIDRAAAARYGLNIGDVQSVVASADRRRKHRRDRRRPGALSDQRALSARMARHARQARRAAHPHAQRQPDHARHGGQGQDQRRPADAEERECAAFGLGLCRRARARPRVHRGRPAGRRVRPGQARTRHEPRLLRPVRVHGARQRTAEARRAGHAADHLRAALSHLQPLRRSRAHHGHAAVRADRRRVVPLPAGLPACRSPPASGSSRWPACRRSSASSCCCT